MITPFRHFIRHLHLLFDDATLSTTQRQQQATQLLKTLVQQHSWLPRAYAEPDPDRYRQMLLYADLHERFSVLSFIWGPGQQTPIHDHGVWGWLAFCAEPRSISATSLLRTEACT